MVTRMQAELEKEYMGWRKVVDQELKITSNRLVVVCDVVRTILSDVKQLGTVAADTLLAVERLERRLDEEQDEALERDEDAEEEPEGEPMVVDAEEDAEAEHEEEGAEKKAEENAEGVKGTLKE